MYAIIKTGGKQYRVAEGEFLKVETLEAEVGAEVVLGEVLAVSTEEGLKVGTPLVEGATVTGKIIKTGKSKKIRVYKMKPKKNYRRTQGHRQPYTKVEITAINA